MNSPTIAVGYLISVLAVCAAAPTTLAFDAGSRTWPDATATFHVDIPVAVGEPNWNDAFEAAMNSWTSVTAFTYEMVRNSFADPCDPPGFPSGTNGVKFSATVCGDAFGSSTLAIATSWFRGSSIVQSGIIFNNNRNWDVYSGDLFRSPYRNVVDFQRVAVHELGHSLGLRHEDSVPAIMSSRADDDEVPLQDDIDGVTSLYGPPPPPPPPPAAGGTDISQIIELLLD